MVSPLQVHWKVGAPPPQGQRPTRGDPGPVGRADLGFAASIQHFKRGDSAAERMQDVHSMVGPEGFEPPTKGL